MAETKLTTSEAGQHIGETATVCGVVRRVSHGVERGVQLLFRPLLVTSSICRLNVQFCAPTATETHPLGDNGKERKIFPLF